MSPDPRSPDPRSQRSGLRADEVIAAVDAFADAPCAGCAEALLGQEVVLGLLMGLKGELRCARCVAAGLGVAPFELLRRAAANVRQLDCFRAGWAHADRRLEARGAWPADRLPPALRMDGELEELDEEPEQPQGAERLLAAASYDAGDMGCGDLVLELRTELARLAPGAVLLVRATDPGAPGDLPAWSRLTGNPLLRQEHPLYWFRRRQP